MTKVLVATEKPFAPAAVDCIKEVFDKASKPFLKKNIFVPYNGGSCKMF